MFVEHKEAGEPQVKPLDEASKLLLKAADLLEERGHCKDVREYQGRFCVMGAISMARWGTTDAHNDRLVIEAADRLGRAVMAGGCYSNAAAVQWNNAAERTKEEVVAKLRAVALGL